MSIVPKLIFKKKIDVISLLLWLISVNKICFLAKEINIFSFEIKRVRTRISCDRSILFL